MSSVSLLVLFLVSRDLVLVLVLVLSKYSRVVVCVVGIVFDVGTKSAVLCGVIRFL